MKSIRYCFMALCMLAISTKAYAQDLFALTQRGGNANQGAIIKYNATNNTLGTVYNFPAVDAQKAIDPELKAYNGKLYGMTRNGGAYDNGVIFEWDPATNVYTKKHDFNLASTTNGAYPEGGLTLVGTKFYGTTTQAAGTNAYGCIFEWDPATNVFTKKYTMTLANGREPVSTLLLIGTKLYGMARLGGNFSGGSIFEWDTSTNTFTRHQSFSQGDYPVGSLVHIGGTKFYGVTRYGGTSNKGVLFEWDSSNNTRTAKYNFTAAVSEPNGSLAYTGSVLYGITYYGGNNSHGTLYEWNPTNSTFTKRQDFNLNTIGGYPQGSLLISGGKCYGMTAFGGANQGGTIYEWNPANNTLTKKQDLAAMAQGGAPTGVLCAFGGKFYGVTSNGGLSGGGVLFEWEATNNVYVKKIDFGFGINGTEPEGNLAFAGGKLYGMTPYGGVNNDGIIFEFDPANNTFTKKQDFANLSKGARPRGGLKAYNGKMYGMTQVGGANNYGTLFEWVPSTNVFTKKIDFDNTTLGGYPQGELEFYNGKFYGLTGSGGANGAGTIFEWDATTNVLTKKYDLPSNGGVYGSLTLVGNTFYGMTYGTGGYGSIFEWNPATNVYTTKYSFSTNQGNNGSSPYGNLTLLGNKLYGMTSGGGANGDGVIFEWDIATNTFTKKFDFNDANGTGTEPFGTLTLLGSKFYGMTSEGGTNNKGTAFEWTPSTNTFVKKQDFTGTNGAEPRYSSFLEPKESQSITFANLPAKTFGDANFNLTATASSGLAVSFTSSNTAVATISGSTVTIVGVGTSIITASQAGNTVFKVAPDVTQTLTVNKANQTITFSALPAKVFGDAPFSVTATASSGLAVSYASSNTAVATVSGSTVTIVGVGSTNITASQAGNANFNPATNVVQSLTVGKANQTITFNTLPAKVFGDANFTLSATASSNLAVSYASSNTAVATVSGNTVTIVGVGSTTITASQAGNTNYNAATNVAQTLTVGKANQTITFGALSAKTFGDANFTVSATVNTGLPITFSSSNTAVATVSGNTITIVGAGTTNIVATQAGNANYNVATVSQSLVVNKADQTITFNALASRTFGDANFNLTATASSGLPVTFASSNTAIVTISGNTVTIVGAGQINVTASQAGNANYNPASKPQALAILKANQTITFGALPTKTMGDAPFDLGATSSSGLAVTYTSSNTNVATISGNTITLVGVGTSTITAVQAGNNNYNPATNITQTLTVNKGNQSITFGALSAKNFGDAPFTLGATASSGLVVSYTSSNTAVATVSGSTVTIVGAGSTNITASQAGNANFNAANNVVQNLTVGKGNQTITFGALPNRAIGTANFNLTATSSSGLAVSYTSSNTAVATISGSTVTIVGVGTTVITASQAGNTNYNAADNVTQNFTVTKVQQTITFPAITDKVYGDSPMTLNATASSNLAVTYSLTTTPATGVATLNGTTVTFIGIGSVSITASQAGNGTYDVAPTVVRTFNVLYPTSLLPTASSIGIIAYPNPNRTGIFLVEVGKLQSVPLIYAVYDLMGKQVAKGSWVGKEVQTLNLPEAPQGIYTLQLQGEKVNTTLKLVKE